MKKPLRCIDHKPKTAKPVLLSVFIHEDYNAEYLGIMDFVFMKNLIAELFIYMSQWCGAVERDSSCFFLLKVYLPRENQSQTKKHKTRTDFFKK